MDGWLVKVVGAPQLLFFLNEWNNCKTGTTFETAQSALCLKGTDEKSRMLAAVMQCCCFFCSFFCFTTHHFLKRASPWWNWPWNRPYQKELSLWTLKPNLFNHRLNIFIFSCHNSHHYFFVCLPLYFVFAWRLRSFSESRKRVKINLNWLATKMNSILWGMYVLLLFSTWAKGEWYGV